MMGKVIIMNMEWGHFMQILGHSIFLKVPLKHKIKYATELCDYPDECLLEDLANFQLLHVSDAAKIGTANSEGIRNAKFLQRLLQIVCGFQRESGQCDLFNGLRGIQIH
jgi:hypothetical protein